MISSHINTVISTMGSDPMQDHDIMEKAGEVLRRGGLVAFPTETVYGLGANAMDACAVKKIYVAKGRPSDNPLIVHVGELAAVEGLVESIPEAAVALMKNFFPGPLTLIFKSNGTIPTETTGGRDTVAIRFPSDKLAQRLIKASGVPIAAPSANLSGRPSPTRAEHVISDLSGRVDMIIDGGEATLGLESTIVDVTGEVPLLLRPGSVTAEMIGAVVGRINRYSFTGGEEHEALAPGMKYKHYAPNAPVTLVIGEQDKIAEKIKQLILLNHDKKVGIMSAEETKGKYEALGAEVITLGSINHPETIARSLYAALRELDEKGVEVIFSEGFSEEHLGLAIMNRLKKASGFNIINV